MCLKCEAEEKVWECQACKVTKPRVAFTESMWAHRRFQRTRCRVCDGEPEVTPCSICKTQKTKDEFPSEQWNNRSRRGRILRCFDCWHPQCTEPSCQTCKVCRNPECTKGANCKEPIVQLNSKHMPSTLAQVESFLCETCRNKKTGDTEVGQGASEERKACSLCSTEKTKTEFTPEQ